MDKFSIVCSCFFWMSLIAVFVAMVRTLYIEIKKCIKHENEIKNG